MVYKLNGKKTSKPKLKKSFIVYEIHCTVSTVFILRNIKQHFLKTCLVVECLVFVLTIKIYIKRRFWDKKWETIYPHDKKWWANIFSL